jgi:hypothetical protein
VPVVLHHGEGGWTVARKMSDLLNWEEPTRGALAAYVPDFELLIDDLTQVPEVELLQRDMAALGKMVIWVLRAVRVGFDPALVPDWADELNRAETAPREALLHLLKYLLGTDEGSSIFEALEKARISEGVREVVMGLRQQWQQEALERGRTEGRTEGRAEVLLKLLQLRFTELPSTVEERVRQASSEEIDRWVERVMTAHSLDDVWD